MKDNNETPRKKSDDIVACLLFGIIAVPIIGISALAVGISSTIETAYNTGKYAFMKGKEIVTTKSEEDEELE